MSRDLFVKVFFGLAISLMLSSPAAARFLQTDPVGYGPDSDLYTYVGNDPTDKTDPTGNDPRDYLPPGYYQYGPMVATPSEVEGAKQGLQALPGVAATVAYDMSPVSSAVDVATGAYEGDLSKVTLGAIGLIPAGKAFSAEKKALVEMAKFDKKVGMAEGDMQAYKALNAQLSDPFPSDQVRGPEAHPDRGPAGRMLHGHVGPVKHIPIKQQSSASASTTKNQTTTAAQPQCLFVTKCP
ncbi:MAG: hypothetical protein HY243_00965 [Proteobacteria bacterium]|nr:hypothetical protein [Pseudomonadota bacterium]